MPQLIDKSVQFPQENISIEEYVGRISTHENRISIGRITSDAGWSEPAQQPQFDEYSIVLHGTLYVTAEDGSVTVVRSGQGVLVRAEERIQYSTPESGGADYIAICLPAFDLKLARRDPM